jgi:alkylation response protein AidB-like acyl-CoA dehydrogenase
MSSVGGISNSDLDALKRSLAARACDYDRSGDWPNESLIALGQAGAWSWAVPTEYDGGLLSPRDLLAAYEAIAGGCMSSALILTQRDGAIDLIRHAANDALKSRLLPQLARGALHTTVGVSQLTTSSRGKGPLMRVVPDGDGYRFSGRMPWVTGAERAAFIVAGGVLPGGDHLLACVSTDQEGVAVGPSFQLMALTASRTSPVHCDNVYVGPDSILRGPAENVLGRRGPAKGLVASTCGLGLAGSLIGLIESMPARLRSPFSNTLEPLADQYYSMRAKLHGAAEKLERPELEYEAPAAAIRVGVNDLVIRLALAALTLGKGSGFAVDHPVQRVAREALFMLVWSAPEAIQTGTLSSLLQNPHPA